jgi:hypothetical protein
VLADAEVSVRSPALTYRATLASPYGYRGQVLSSAYRLLGPQPG